MTRNDAIELLPIIKAWSEGNENGMGLKSSASFFTEEEIEKNALKAIIINKEKLKSVIKTLSFRK